MKQVFFILLFFSLSSKADIEKNLSIGLTEHEKLIVSDYIETQKSKISSPPVGPIYSLGEWEESDAVLTLWNNESFLRALSDNGNVKILADNISDQNEWLDYLKNAGLNLSKFSFYIVPTNSIWVRDYGPWWIVNGTGDFGIVDTIYNRPRPQDDVVPDFIGKQLNVPVYKPGLVHTGGNYYSDGLGNAFSSTLPFKENKKLSVNDILNRMLSYLGIEVYTTSPLGEDVTIEHLDTFGKLVSPDTWVFSEFPKSSRFYKDSEKMVSILKSQISPYGTPYKIHRLKMVADGGENYRAYINSFISNGTLYFPKYGDSLDETVKSIYQQALPGYQIIGVSAQNTEWGDSVHCRSRNLIKKDTIFIFPKVQRSGSSDFEIQAKIFPTPNFFVESAEVVFLKNGTEVFREPMALIEGHNYKYLKSNGSSKNSDAFYISAKDSSGKSKTHPLLAPKMSIRLE